MCLITENKKGLVSDEPIKCYKIYKKGKEDGVIESVLQGVEYRVKEGDVVEAEGTGDIRKEANDPDGDVWILDEGYIHAFRNRHSILFALSWSLGVIKCLMDGECELNEKEKSVIATILDDILHTMNSALLYEMEIPVGEKYWLGIDGDICAKRMILAREFKITKRSELLELIMEGHKSTYPNLRKKEVMRAMKRYRELIKQYKEKGQ